MLPTLIIRLSHHLRVSVLMPPPPCVLVCVQIRGLREEASLDGREPKQLVYVKPDDNLAKVVRTLSDHKCSMAPILSCDPGGLSVPTVLHIATLSGVLACLMRHFRASLASLPLLSQPLGHLPLGTWAPDSSGGLTQSHADLANGREHGKQVRPLHTVHPSTPLTTALGMLLETGVSDLQAAALECMCKPVSWSHVPEVVATCWYACCVDQWLHDQSCGLFWCAVLKH